MNCEHGFYNEFDTFILSQETMPMNLSSRMLWLVLFQRANRHFWNGALHYSTRELASSLKVSESTIKRARNELVENNFLLYDRGTSIRHSGQYLLLSAVSHGDVIVPRAQTMINKAGDSGKTMMGGDSV